MRQVGPHQMETLYVWLSGLFSLLSFLSFFESESYVVVQTGLELAVILLPQPPTIPSIPCTLQS